MCRAVKNLIVNPNLRTTYTMPIRMVLMKLNFYKHVAICIYSKVEKIIQYIKLTTQLTH